MPDKRKVILPACLFGADIQRIQNLQKYRQLFRLQPLIQPSVIVRFQCSTAVFQGIRFCSRKNHSSAFIVRVHFPDIDNKLLTQVLETFYKIRSLPTIKKKPSTSEIIDWIQALQHGGVSVDKIVKEVPYLGVLLKKNEDIDTLRRQWR